MLEKKRNNAGLITSVVLTLVMVLSGAWLLLNRQYVVDQLSVWGYTPSASIQRIIDRVDFAPKGDFYFRTSQPVVSSADAFNSDCPQREVNNPILGCYNGQGIFIYDIQNDELDGIKEVTAAHEMLHSVWDRLDDKEKERLGVLLNAELNTITDESFLERMDYYKRNQPGEVTNELHSIIGTEFANISDELETYYQQYFKDRSHIVALHDKYNHVFTDLKIQAETLHKELVVLSESIQSRSTQYEEDVKKLASDINDFNRRAENGSFSTMSQFNQERAALVARSSSLDAQRDQLNQDIATYNTKYNQYQSVAVEIQELNKSINSMSSVSEAPSFE